MTYQPVEVKEEIDLYLTGRGRAFGHEMHPFGKYQGLVVLIGNDKEPWEGGDRPGDHVTARITSVSKMHAHAEVLENHGPFLDDHEGERYQIKITHMSFLDARDALSIPWRYRGHETGLSGCNVLIKECHFPGVKLDRRIRDFVLKEADVTVKNWTRQKDGDYIIFSYLSDPEDPLKRVPGEYLFLASFPIRDEDDVFDEIESGLKGIPEEDPPDAILMLSGDSGKITYRNNGGGYKDLYGLGILDSITEYIKFLGGIKHNGNCSDFPLVLTTKKEMENVEHAANEIGLRTNILEAR